MSGPTWAVACDFSEVIETPDGFGRFKTKLAALDRQISYLEVQRDETARYLAKAKRLRRAEIKRNAEKGSGL